ncbi:unnamed protein product [Linum trigynum]|uniref:Uncharacterized protein n=1 Tax=Linum trigynum TaxID=586398 RepID=A0AAV2EQB1_9ROSI
MAVIVLDPSSSAGLLPTPPLSRMKAVVLNPTSSAGLLPTPPPSKRLLPLPCSLSASSGFGGGYNRKSCSSTSPSPPRQNHEKKQKTTANKKLQFQRCHDSKCAEKKKKPYYSGASFSVPSPPPDSLPLPSFLSGGPLATRIQSKLPPPLQKQPYSRDFLLSLSQSAPATCPPIHHQLDLSRLPSGIC